MNTIAHWNPFRDLEAFQDRLATAYNSPPSKLAHDKTQSDVPSEFWMPLVDITEDEKEFTIMVELPQINKEDVHVVVVDSVLTISGERKVNKDEKDKKYHRIERSYGRFSRSFSLADNVDGSEVEANFKNGMLRVSLRKSEKSKPKTIEVKVG